MTNAMTNREIVDAIHAAWADVPAPATGLIEQIAWSSGEDSWRTFAGVAPLDVDISSVGFLGCTPLLDIAPEAAAPYLAPYLLSLLDSLAVQEEVGLFHDILTRSHLIHCLRTESFWETTVRPHLSPVCRGVLLAFVRYLVARREAIALPPEQASQMLGFAEASVAGA